jgi:hypothetical protein
MSNADEYVYVNQDGSVRELALDEREYLSETFGPGDGGRPYVKLFYGSRDGWGSVSWFLARTQVPRRLQIEPVNPNYVPPKPTDARHDLIEQSRRAGDIVTESPDGSVSCAPSPQMSRATRFERFRQIQLERQRESEKQARHPDYVEAYWRQELARLDRTEAVLSWSWWTFVALAVLTRVLAMVAFTPQQIYQAMRVPLSLPWFLLWALPFAALLFFVVHHTRVAWSFDRRFVWLPSVVACWYILTPGIVGIFALYVVRWRVVHGLQVHSKAFAFQSPEVNGQ